MGTRQGSLKQIQQFAGHASCLERTSGHLYGVPFCLAVVWFLSNALQHAHVLCTWRSRVMPVAVTYHSSVDSSYCRTSQCALRNAAVLAVVVIPVQCPYRRLPYVSRRSFQFNVRTVACPITITHARLDILGGVVCAVALEVTRHASSYHAPLHSSGCPPSRQ